MTPAIGSSPGLEPGRERRGGQLDPSDASGQGASSDSVLVSGLPAPASQRDAVAARPDRGRLDLVLPILLAAFGVAAALIAWRATVAAGAADAANGAGLAAARLRASTLIVSEGLTSRTVEAYTDYERARRRGDLLAAADQASEAQRARMEATSHWFLVYPDYVDTAGVYQPDLHRAALLAGNEGRRDIRAEPHFALADAETARLRALVIAGIIVAFALPFLTLAEIGRGRLRAGGAILGTGLLLAGTVLAAVVWL